MYNTQFARDSIDYELSKFLCIPRDFKRKECKMKYILIIIVLYLVQDYGYGISIASEDKRQVPIDCFTAYNSLSTNEKSCVSNISIEEILFGHGPQLSPSDFTDLCVSTVCMNTATKLLEACKVS